MKRNSIFLIIAFALILLSVPVYWLVKEDSPQNINWVEGRVMNNFSIRHRGWMTSVKYLLRGDAAMFSEMLQKDFVDGAFQADFEAAASDQFPFRLALIQTAKTLERLVIRSAYALTKDPAIPADMQSVYYVMRDRSAIFERPVPSQALKLEAIDRRIENYQVLLEKYPEIDFYVYVIERIQYSRFHPLNPYFKNVDAGQFLEYFLANHPDELHVDRLALTSFDDFLKVYYHSDHHWNIHGVLRAYQDIHRMLQQNNPEISPLRVYEDFIQLDGVHFQGTAARRSFYPFDAEIFEVVDYDLPPHQVFINGVEGVYGGSEKYFAGKFSTEPFYNHYEGFFGGDLPLIEFVFDTGSDRNLLVLGNSYDNALVPLLASHYHHTYSVDLRHYPKFSLSDFMAEHPVDDVIVIGENPYAFASEKYLIKP